MSKILTEYEEGAVMETAVLQRAETPSRVRERFEFSTSHGTRSPAGW